MDWIGNKRECDQCGRWCRPDEFAMPHDPYCARCMEESYSMPYWRDVSPQAEHRILAQAWTARDVRRALMERQQGECAICHTLSSRLVVDHDHETGFVRGLLCNNCNTALGHFRDDPIILKAAIAYLTKHPAKHFGVRYTDISRPVGRRLKRKGA